MKEKKDKKEKRENRVFNIFGLIVNIIALCIVIVFFAVLYFSYTNFNAVKDGKEPTGYKDVKKYVKNDRNVVVYDYTIYKIEVIKYSGVETYTLKPFFVENY